jgi:hypothetical protein
MANELKNVITQVATYLAALSGIRAAPTAPPENIQGNYPFVITRPDTGTFTTMSAAFKRGEHSIVIELHVARKDLPRDVATAMPFCDSIPNLLMSQLFDDKWGGTIDTFRDISYRFVSWNWEGGLTTIGFEFTVRGIKIQGAIT